MQVVKKKKEKQKQTPAQPFRLMSVTTEYNPQNLQTDLFWGHVDRPQ